MADFRLAVALQRCRHLHPIGYKIALEFLSEQVTNLREIPIFFRRDAGCSKLTLTQQLLYLRHLSLYIIFQTLNASWEQTRRFTVISTTGKHQSGDANAGHEWPLRFIPVSCTT
jgi:hypothetical protein